MFVVSEKAAVMIKELLSQRENVSPIRILLVEASWAGQTLAMVLDEPRNGDEVFNVDGIAYLMEKGFFEGLKPVKIDYIDDSNGSKFSISSVAYNFSLRVCL